MIGLVETNFLLELALKQSEFNDAEQILGLAERGVLQLAVPAYSLVEPRYKLVGERSERRRLRDTIEQHVKQISRSQGFRDLREQSNTLLTTLANKADSDVKEYEEVVLRLLKCAMVIPLTGEVISAARARQLFDLEPPDALVFSSIEAFLKAHPGSESVFANKDAQGFMQKTVVDDLASLGCEVIPTFSGALSYIRKKIQDSNPPGGT